ncbi:lipocalin family protein [Rheinheimera texasensis]|uniref:lipocalin family protein n=1 Tax=Rheinheimera texasensis TaxID=306205 RepID=UPI0004E2851B|nr:lipocalin family protein [Rheinheimera texasensis]
MKLLSLKAPLLAASLLLASCTGIPEGLAPVQPFELNRYLGEWHEIARLDHSFERGLTQVTANYSLNPDGSVKVLNRGFSAQENEWEEAEGLAKMNGPADQGRLKVSFFGPFYGAYNIVKLAPDYSMALIVGPDLTYAWLLARSPNPDKTQCQAFFDEATRIGIKPDSWIRLSPC